METVQQNGRFTLFSSKFHSSNIYSILFVLDWSIKWTISLISSDLPCKYYNIRFDEKLCLIEYELDINVYNFENWLFSIEFLKNVTTVVNRALPYLHVVSLEIMLTVPLMMKKIVENTHCNQTDYVFLILI